jgi:SAM-dependent methyltransferase
MANADEVREQQRRNWESVSGSWAHWDELVIGWLRPVGDAMIADLALRGEGDHLDIASGSGEPALSIAQVMPHGRVTLTDMSSGMLEVAARRAKARGLTNVDVRECSVDELPFDDASFDTISCRFAFMFFPDIPRAVAEVTRVLRPGGRISVGVWGEPGGNPWATLPRAAIDDEVRMPAPDPDAPNLWRCSKPRAIADLFTAAGLHDVVEHDVYFTLDARDGDEFFDFITEISAPVRDGLASADDAGRARIRAATLEGARAFQDGNGLRIPSHARAVVGTK